MLDRVVSPELPARCHCIARTFVIAVRVPVALADLFDEFRSDTVFLNGQRMVGVGDVACLDIGKNLQVVVCHLRRGRQCVDDTRPGAG